MVYILLAPGFEEAEALVPADLLRRAGIETALVSLEGDSVTGSHQITVKADLELSQVDLGRASMLMLPGGGRGVENLGKSPAAAALVREAAEGGVPLAAICAAPTLLARWGLLEGKQAVCYPGMENQLTGALIRAEAGVVEDGDRITGRAAGSAFDFGLALVRYLAGSLPFSSKISTRRFSFSVNSSLRKALMENRSPLPIPRLLQKSLNLSAVVILTRTMVTRRIRHRAASSAVFPSQGQISPLFSRRRKQYRNSSLSASLRSSTPKASFISPCTLS